MMIRRRLGGYAKANLRRGAARRVLAGAVMGAALCNLPPDGAEWFAVFLLGFRGPARPLVLVQPTRDAGRGDRPARLGPGQPHWMFEATEGRTLSDEPAVVAAVEFRDEIRGKSTLPCIFVVVAGDEAWLRSVFRRGGLVLSPEAEARIAGRIACDGEALIAGYTVEHGITLEQDAIGTEQKPAGRTA